MFLALSPRKVRGKLDSLYQMSKIGINSARRRRKNKLLEDLPVTVNCFFTYTCNFVLIAVYSFAIILYILMPNIFRMMTFLFIKNNTPTRTVNLSFPSSFHFIIVHFICICYSF